MEMKQGLYFCAIFLLLELVALSYCEGGGTDKGASVCDITTICNKTVGCVCTSADENIGIRCTNVQLQGKPFAECLNGSVTSIKIQGSDLTALPVFSKQTNLTSLAVTDSPIASLLPTAFNGLTNLQNLEISGTKINTIPDKPFQNLNALVTVKLQNNSLTTLPENLFAGCCSKVITLNVSMNAITGIKFNPKNPTPALNNLDLSNNKISDIDSNSFHNMELVSLNLHNNSLTSLSDSLFDVCCSKMTTLDVSMNAITHIKVNTLKKLTALNQMDWSNNKISTIDPNSFDTMTALTSVKVDNNKLAALPDNLFAKCCAKVTMLDLSMNAITGIKADTLSNLPALIQLDLSNNKLSIIDNSSFDSMVALSTLYLYNNSLTSLPDNVFVKCTDLTSLDLSINGLKEITAKTLTSLKALRYLDVSYNKITNIAETSFDSMAALEIAVLGNNSLVTLPKSLFAKSTKVGNVDLSNNLLQDTSYVSNSGLLNVTMLNLDGNNFTKINSDAFKGMTKITELHLSHMPNLMDVMNGTFTPPANTLTQLFMSNNPNLTGLPANFFSTPMPKLTDLHINNNHLTHLPDELFNGTMLPAIQTVEVHDNPVLCDCNVIWILKDLNTSAKEWILPWKTALKCGAPPRFMGNLVSEMEMDFLTCNPPVINQSAQYKEVNGGQDYFIEVHLTEGLPTTTWLTPKGQKIEPGKVYNTSYGLGNITVTERVIDNICVHSHLDIAGYNSNSEGTYTLIAVNAGGNITQKFDVGTSSAEIAKKKRWKKIGLIAGCVVAGILVIGIVVVVVRKVRQRRKNRQNYEHIVQ